MRNHQKPIFALAMIVVFAAFLISLPALISAGSLEPPAAPGSTMKTLDEVEPRIPIDSLPYTISQPGSYYFTGNLTYSVSGTAITVDARPVKIDLMGFTIDGLRTADTFGIKSNFGDTEIINGAIQGFDTGIQSNFATMKVDNVLIVDNLGVGISFSAGIIKDSVIRGNGTHGINGSYNMIIGNMISGHPIGIETSWSFLDRNMFLSNDTDISPCGTCVFGLNFMP